MASNDHRMPLPREIFWYIFKFCDVQTLGRLSRTCTTFRDMIRIDCIWNKKWMGALASNCENEEFFRKTKPVLNNRDKCRISSRWRHNICRRNLVIKCHKLMIVNLELDGDALYCNHGRNLHKYDRAPDGSVIPRVAGIAETERGDITCFVVIGDEIISGSRQATMYCHNKRTLNRIVSHDIISPQKDNSIDCIAADQDMIVCGCRDSKLRIFRKEKGILNSESEIFTGSKVLSAAIMPFTRKLVAGFPSTQNVHPLKIYDIETRHFMGNLGTSYVKGAGILSITPENSQTLLVGGYDTMIRLWDIRTPQKCVSMWEEPNDNSIYCVQSDKNVTFVSGSCRNSLMHLWDKRNRKCVQQQYVEGYESSVHSIVFDACRKIVALDTAVFEFNYNV